MPTVEGLFGDKMTAISPKTLGLNLTKGGGMEYLKQIIYFGSLFGLLNDLNDVRDTFANTTKQGNGFRKSRYSQDEMLNNVIDVAFKYSQWLLKGAGNVFREIESINKKFNGHRI
jgi:hypothetical protein